MGQDVFDSIRIGKTDTQAESSSPRIASTVK